MERIRHLKEYLLTVHPVRMTSEQKEDFRRWAMGELKRAGWKARAETYGKLNGSINVVAGDPEQAEIIFCAHYDTGSRMWLPNFVSPTNVLAHFSYHFAVGMLLVVLALMASLAISFPLKQPQLALPLFLVFEIVLLWLSGFGFANPNNANGNSSGVLTLLSLARELARNKRVAFVLLDNNERDLLGASAFRKKHFAASERALFINLDCVGDGEHMLLMPSKHSRWDGDLLAALGNAFPESGEVRCHVLDKGLVYYPSDHRKFKFHVAICACHRLAGVGYYIPRLRSKRDTVLDENNILLLRDALMCFPRLYRGSRAD